MSPEYAMLGKFSEKSDVFSFGVMIIEIITGKRNAKSYESNHDAKGLLSYVSVISSIFKLSSHLCVLHVKKNCFDENIAP